MPETKEGEERRKGEGKRRGKEGGEEGIRRERGEGGGGSNHGVVVAAYCGLDEARFLLPKGLQCLINVDCLLSLALLYGCVQGAEHATPRDSVTEEGKGEDLN